MADAREDLWGEAAIRAPGGPSYEFFRDLLPPLRYVNTAFKHYPIVLSAPLAPVKARWVSNGSGINLRATKPPMWKEPGTPVAFFVGEKEEAFSVHMEKLDGPRYNPLSPGRSPAVQVRYSSSGTVYDQHAFAGVRGTLAEHGVVFVRFEVSKKAGRVMARIGTGKGTFKGAGDAVLDEKGCTVIQFDLHWKCDGGKQELTTDLKSDQHADLLVSTKPAAETAKERPSGEDEATALRDEWKFIFTREIVLRLQEGVVFRTHGNPSSSATT